MKSKENNLHTFGIEGGGAAAAASQARRGRFRVRSLSMMLDTIYMQIKIKLMVELKRISATKLDLDCEIDSCGEEDEECNSKETRYEIPVSV